MSMLVEDYFAEAFDVVAYLHGDKCDLFFDRVVKEAEKFFDKNGYSPIVEIEQKRYTTYGVDYFFLVDVLSKHIESYVKEEELKDLVRTKVRNEFSKENENFMKNGKFLLCTLQYFGYIVPTSNYKYLYLKNSYLFKKNDIRVVMDIVFFKKEAIADYKKYFLKIADNTSYRLLGTGPSYTAVLFRNGMKDNFKVYDFEF